MRQTDHSIISRTNIQTDIVVINQTDYDNREAFEFLNHKGEKCEAIFISTTERGLSRSRNMAVRNATADICLLCDDDEILNDDYPERIIDSFREEDADIIAFQIEDAGKKYPSKRKRIGYIGALKLGSWQIAFKRESFLSKGLSFDLSIGSGVANGGGEENKFIYDALAAGLKVIYVPVSIGRMIPSESFWFHGFSREYFHDRGIMTKKLMGSFYATLYAVYFLIRKYPLYKSDINFAAAAKELFKELYPSNEN